MCTYVYVYKRTRAHTHTDTHVHASVHSKNGRQILQKIDQIASNLLHVQRVARRLACFDS